MTATMMTKSTTGNCLGAAVMQASATLLNHIVGAPALNVRLAQINSASYATSNFCLVFASERASSKPAQPPN